MEEQIHKIRPWDTKLTTGDLWCRIGWNSSILPYQTMSILDSTHSTTVYSSFWLPFPPSSWYRETSSLRHHSSYFFYWSCFTWQDFWHCTVWLRIINWSDFQASMKPPTWPSWQLLLVTFLTPTLFILAIEFWPITDEQPLFGSAFGWSFVFNKKRFLLTYPNSTTLV